MCFCSSSRLEAWNCAHSDLQTKQATLNFRYNFLASSLASICIFVFLSECLQSGRLKAWDWNNRSLYVTVSREARRKSWRVFESVCANALYREMNSIDLWRNNNNNRILSARLGCFLARAIDDASCKLQGKSLAFKLKLAKPYKNMHTKNKPVAMSQLTRFSSLTKASDLSSSANLASPPKGFRLALRPLDGARCQKWACRKGAGR